MKSIIPCTPAAVYVIMYTMGKSISATQARKQFFKLLENVGTSDSPVRITLEGHPSVVLLSEEEYESLIETLEILSDPELVKSIEEGMRDVKAGRTIPWEKVKKELHL